MHNLSRPKWRKSTKSGANNGQCVEVANLGNNIGVRDSKNRDGGILSVSPAAWAAFVKHVTV
jgi:hypothetical protein